MEAEKQWLLQRVPAPAAVERHPAECVGSAVDAGSPGEYPSTVEPEGEEEERQASQTVAKAVEWEALIAVSEESEDHPDRRRRLVGQVRATHQLVREECPEEVVEDEDLVPVGELGPRPEV